MAEPNVVNVSTITGKTALLNIPTSWTTLVSNPAASGKVLKINSLYISCTASGVTVYVKGKSSKVIISGTTVPAGTTLDVLSRPIYIEEGETLAVYCSLTPNYAFAICSYEEIS